MAHYLIWVPETNLPQGHLATLGLESLLRGDKPMHSELAKGPTDGRGTLYYWGMTASGCYRADTQRWAAAKPNPVLDLPAGRFWIGTDGAPPTPADLALPRQLQGIPVELRDRHRWLVPEARLLPHVWGLGDDGQFAQRTLPEYDAFCRLAERSKACIAAYNPDEDLRLVDGWTFAVMALGLNYRVNEDVVDFLGLLDQPTALAVILATLGQPIIDTVESDQKKTA